MIGLYLIDSDGYQNDPLCARWRVICKLVHPEKA